MEHQACVAAMYRLGRDSTADDNDADRFGRKQGGKLTAKWMRTVLAGSGASKVAR